MFGYVKRAHPRASDDAIRQAIITAVKFEGAAEAHFKWDGDFWDCVVRAVQKTGGDDVDKMISALEGWKFLAPKGPQRIRPEDHATLQPMFRVQLVNTGSRLSAKVLGTANSFQTAPPQVAMKG